MSAMTHIFAGNIQPGKDCELEYSSLSPIDLNASITGLARAHVHLAEYDQACQVSELVLGEFPKWLSAQTILAASLSRQNREPEAKAICAAILGQNP